MTGLETVSIRKVAIAANRAHVGRRAIGASRPDDTEARAGQASPGTERRRFGGRNRTGACRWVRSLRRAGSPDGAPKFRTAADWRRC
jgi:hypothetical protein